MDAGSTCLKSRGDRLNHACLGPAEEGRRIDEADVRLWHKADIQVAPGDVCFRV